MYSIKVLVKPKKYKERKWNIYQKCGRKKMEHIQKM